MFKSASTTSIPQTISNGSIGPSEKRQKHSSLLGRFARRFSIMRRAAPAHSRRGSVDTTNEWSRGDRQSLQVTDHSTTTRPPSLASPMSPVSPSENRRSARVSPSQAGITPSPDSTPLGTPEDGQLLSGEETPGGKRDSMSSLEVSYSIGRLTVVNPDDPSSTDTSPANPSQPLPSIKTALAPAQMPSPVVDKPLPPPASPSFPAFLEVPKFESLSSLIPAPSESAAPTRAPAPVTPALRTRAISGEGQKPQSTLPSSQPVPIPRAVSKSEKRAPRSLPTSATPAPSASLSPPTGPTNSRVSVSAPPAIDDSPLSRASIIANPPTPYVEPTRINNPPVPVQVPAPPPTQVSVPSPVISQIISSPQRPTSNESHTPPLRESLPTRNQETRYPKSSSSVRTRETETFHLVRSPSAGAVQATGQSIIVAGEQWDVVGGGAQRSRSKKEKEDARRSNVEPGRRESKRQDRTVEKVMSLYIWIFSKGFSLPTSA